MKIEEYQQYLKTDNWFDYASFYDWIVENNTDFRKFAEIGVWKGHSITHLAKKLKNRKDVEIFAIDLWDETYKYDGVIHGTEELKLQKKYLYEIYDTNVKNEGVRSLIKDFKQCSWEASSNFEDESLDFIFIDAGHDYEEVMKDLESWIPKVKFSGIIAGHDYFNSQCGVKKAVDEKFQNEIHTFDSCWMVYKKSIK